MTYEGVVVGGRFAVDRLAGRGGMGTVYHATDRVTGADVALKVLHEGATEDSIERFAREVVLLAELVHPGFVRYIEHGKTHRDQPYLAMEWLEGEELSVRLRRAGLTASEAVRFVGRVAAALGVAHARGIVHRDVKPANLMLVDKDLDRVKVLDLGIARARQAIDMTRTGAAIGTPRYMAPEQARGSRELDARADVFSLGCVLFECLVGHPPFTGDTPMAVLAKILLEDAPKLSSERPDLPAELEDVLGRMLAKEPAARPRDGGEVAELLARLGDLGDVRAEAVRARDSAITIGEQKLVCVVLAGSVVERPAIDATIPELSTNATDNTALASPSEVVLPALSSAVALHGGRAEVLHDGSIVVTVLGQGTATDQVARAARCALAVREVVPLAPMALAMGRCVVADRSPFGALIDRAARLLLRAPPGAGRKRPIRVDEVSAGLLDVRFMIDGDDGGLALVGERDVAEAARTLLGRPTACVGRERELAALGAIFEECVAEPMAHAVIVTAAAGVGKSRLRHELLVRLADHAEIWIGRGNPMSAGAPFGMLAEALRRVAGIVDGEPLAVRHAKLRARVTRNVPLVDAPMIAEFLGELVGAPLPEGGSLQLVAARRDPQLLGDQMLRACEDFFAAECAAHPVVLVLEDLHWGDLPTVRFVDAILRQLPDRPLLVIAFARPEIDVTFPRLWAERNAERISLGELTKRAAEKLVREALSGHPVDDATIARVVERAAGNAFYLEELVRSVAEGKGDSLPETVIAMAQARIEGLEFEARHVLRAASIFGQVFWRGGVAALLDGGATSVHDWIDELVRRELVTARRETRFANETELTFRHALVREAAYAMLTDRDRMLGHRAAGEWIEARVHGEHPLERAGESDAVALAEHFERGGEPRRSIAWYRRAAEQALEGDDLASAIERAERAIACTRIARERSIDTETSDDDARELVGSLRQLQAGAHAWRGEYALAAERGGEAMQLLPPGSEAWLRAAAAIADAETRRVQHAAVRALCAQLVDTPADVTTHRVYAHAVAMTMSAILYIDAPLADRLHARLDAIEREIGDSDPVALAWILHARSWRAMRDGDSATCLRLDTRVVACFTSVGDLRHACQQRANVGYDEMILGAYPRAERSLRDAIAVAERMGLHQVRVQAEHNLGFVLARQGRTEEAREVEARALAALEAQANVRLATAARHYLAIIELVAGNYAAAIKLARASIEGARDMPALAIQFHATLSTAYRHAGDLAHALEHATIAVRGMDEHGRPEEGEAEVLLRYAEALRATGALDAALRAIDVAEHRLLAAASRISDPQWRTSFLEQVPEHATTLRLAAAWR